jgi:microcystin-dependent protein
MSQINITNTGIVINNEDSFSIPVGSILIWLTDYLPNINYLYCNGDTFNPVHYSQLYTIIGTSYGGTSTQPKLPNLCDRSPIGGPISSGIISDTLSLNPSANDVESTTKTGGNSELHPNQLIHTHVVTGNPDNITSINNSGNNTDAQSPSNRHSHSISAHHSNQNFNGGTGSYSTHIPPNSKVNYIIYAGTNNDASTNFI